MTTNRDARNFKKGYQEALMDILVALQSGGETEAREWIKNNLDAKSRTR